MVHKQVQATRTPQTAQLKVLAEGLQQVHLIAQNAHEAVAHALAATLQDTAQSTAGQALPLVSAHAAAGMSMDPDPYNDHLGNPVNPRLPTYTGVEDPGLGLLQVQTFGLSMVTAFSGPAMKFWFVECAGHTAELEIIATKLKLPHLRV